jgi:hypothetical protein
LYAYVYSCTFLRVCRIWRRPGAAQRRTHASTACHDGEAGFRRSIAVAGTSAKLGTAVPFGVLTTDMLQHLVLEADADAAHIAASERQGLQLLHARA